MKNELETLKEQLLLQKRSLQENAENLKRLNLSSASESFNKTKVSDKNNNTSQKTSSVSDFSKSSNRVIRLNSTISSNDRKRKDSESSDFRNNKRKNLEDTRSSKKSNSHSDIDDVESGAEDNNTNKPAIKSWVVSSNMPIKSKEELIKIQNKYNGSEQRNKRIFGVILGTLRQFKTEDKERSSTTQAINRKELEKKIEIKKIEEKKKIMEEKKKLEEEKLRGIRNIEILEQKIKLTQEFDEWKQNQIQYRNFIRTKTKPFIFYLPKELDDISKNLLEETANLINDQILKKEKETESEIEVLSQESDAIMKNENYRNQSTEENKENKKEKVTETDSSDSEMDEEKNNINVRIGDEDEDEDMSLTKKSNNPKNDHSDDKLMETSEVKEVLDDIKSSF